MSTLKNVNEVIEQAVLNQPENEDRLLELLSISKLEYLALKAHLDPNSECHFDQESIDSIIKGFIYVFSIQEHGDFEELSPTCYSGDYAAYPPDGTWNAKLYGFLGHYMWIEPEGQTYGFFSSLHEARRFGESNYNH